MVQASDKQGRETYVEVRNDIRFYHNNETQKHKGWYWCYEKQGYFRHSDWFLSIEEMEKKYG